MNPMLSPELKQQAEWLGISEKELENILADTDNVWLEIMKRESVKEKE